MKGPGLFVTLFLVVLLFGSGAVGVLLPQLEGANFCRIVFFIMLGVWAVIILFFFVIRNSPLT